MILSRLCRVILVGTWEIEQAKAHNPRNLTTLTALLPEILLYRVHPDLRVARVGDALSIRPAVHAVVGAWEMPQAKGTPDEKVSPYQRLARRLREGGRVPFL